MKTAVIVPVGHDDPALRAQLRAVLAQGVPFDFEVIVSVNTDDRDAVASIAAQVDALGDSRVRTVSSADLRSAAHARNIGAAAASDDVDTLVFCDADDLVTSGWLSAIVSGLAYHVAVGGHLQDEHPDPRQAHWRPPATPGELPAFLGVPYIVTANMAIRRDAFMDVGGFDTDLLRCEDIAISWALLRDGHTVGFVPEAIVTYRHRAGLWPLLRQHEMYGRGMSQVLARYGLPTGDEWAAPKGAAMLRPNGQRAGRRSVVGTMRRGAIAIGRVRGMVSERFAKPTAANRPESKVAAR